VLSGCVPWPEEFVNRYRREGLWTDETLGSLIEPWAQAEGSRVALVTDAGVTTYTELDAHVRKVDAGLQHLGIKPGDRVVIQLPNSIELLTISLSLFRLGALPVFALPAHRRQEILYLCEHSESVAYVIPGTHLGFDYRALAEEVRGRAPHLRHVISTGDATSSCLALKDLIDSTPARYPEFDSGEVAFFLLSGGTTGTPKLIPRTHRDYIYQLRATAVAVGLDRDSVYLAALPVAHNAALGWPGALGTLRAGGKVVLSVSPSPGEVFPLIERERVTLTTLMPSILKLWVEMAEFLPTDLSGVLFQVGGALLDPQVALSVYSKLGARLTQWFGMAEGFLSHTRLDDPEEVVANSSGRPLSAADEVRVVNETDREVEPGRTGELLVRGPTTLRGYYKAEDYNRTTFTTDGYLRTGDLVRITERGDLSVEGRIKDIVNRGGEKVPVEELEQQLMMHEDVRQAAVVAMADAVMVEKTCAFIVAGPKTPALAELRQFLRDAGLADFKLPDHIEIVESLPYTSLGKINKRILRERIAELRDGPRSSSFTRRPRVDASKENS
jgi:2,3-dihydroxybenzoate-AMP ligase